MNPHISPASIARPSFVNSKEQFSTLLFRIFSGPKGRELIAQANGLGTADSHIFGSPERAEQSCFAPSGLVEIVLGQDQRRCPGLSNFGRFGPSGIPAFAGTFERTSKDWKFVCSKSPIFGSRPSHRAVGPSILQPFDSPDHRMESGHLLDAVLQSFFFSSRPDAAMH